MAQDFPLVIVGGSSLVAPYLMDRLHKSGLTAIVLARKLTIVPEGFTFTQMDLEQDRNWIVPENAIVASLLPLPTLIKFMPRFIGAKAIVAVSSTSIFSKAGSSDEKERVIAKRLAQAEREMLEWARKGNIAFTLLRPTMIYDGVKDNNVARIARIIRKFHAFPLGAPATGKRQPIHADDVAKAVMNAFHNEASINKDFNIAGDEILTYREMVERIFRALNKQPRLIVLPPQIWETGFKIGARLGLINEKSFGAAIFQRMNEDLIFDVTEGKRVLNYQPRKFAPEFK